MRRRLKKYGNSLALVIDKPVLELVGFTADTELEIRSPDGKSLSLVPVDDAGLQREKFDAAVRFVFEKYDQALRKLAE